MSSSLNVDMPPQEATPSNALDPTAWRVDQVIAHLFPAPTLGQLFLARFRERAACERSILPDEPEDTAIILTRSIATLAKELDLSNDTTQKYVVIFIALGLLRKRKLMGQLAFVTDTGIVRSTRNVGGQPGLPPRPLSWSELARYGAAGEGALFDLWSHLPGRTRLSPAAPDDAPTKREKRIQTCP